jgi:hypothetical protein
MLHHIASDFVPHIHGLSGKQYLKVCRTLLNGGFLAGFSIRSERVIVGFVTSCGFTRLINLNNETTCNAFADPTRLFRALAHEEQIKEDISQPSARSWIQRPSSVRCAALAGLIKTGVVFDQNLSQSFGTIGGDEQNILFLRAIHDVELRAALGESFNRWGQKHLKPGTELPTNIANEDFEWSKELEMQLFQPESGVQTDAIDHLGGLN